MSHTSKISAIKKKNAPMPGYRSFYCMRIPEEDAGAEGVMVIGAPEDKLDRKH